MNSNHLNIGQYGCLVFKWLIHMTLWTIQILDILDHKQAFFQSGFKTIIQILDHFTTGHISTI